MAFVHTIAGLDYKQGVYPKGGASPATLYLGLFASQSAATVPSQSATGGASPSGWAEATGINYARQAIAAASWGAPETVTLSGLTGRKVTATQVAFPAAGSGGWGTINGFFLATHAQSEVGDIVLSFANFDDLTAEVVNAGGILKITPFMVELSGP